MVEFQYTRIFNEHSSGIPYTPFFFFITVFSSFLPQYFFFFNLSYFFTSFFFLQLCCHSVVVVHVLFFLLQDRENGLGTEREDGSDWNREFIVPRTQRKSRGFLYQTYIYVYKTRFWEQTDWRRVDGAPADAAPITYRPDLLPHPRQ